MTLNVAYRCTIYASKAVDSTEATVLTPAAGAPHSQQFKIATLEGVAGFQQYMGMPSGRRGRIDLLAKKTDTGELTFDVLDQRTTPGGSNVLRWMTAFMGDARTTPQLARLKVFIEESLDSGVTWKAFFTGRVKSVGLKTGSRVVYQVTVRDMADDLTFNIFTGAPHPNVLQNYTLGGSGYVQLIAVMPVGLAHPYGNAQLAAGGAGALTGFVQAVDARGFALVSFDPSQRGVPDNQYNATLHQATLGASNPFAVPVSTPAPTVTPTFSGQAVARLVMKNATGTATGTQSSTTLKDTTKVWVVNQWVGQPVTLTGGTGSGQTRFVLSNTVDTLTVVTAWGTTPVAGSTTYSIAAEGDFYVGYGYVPLAPSTSYQWGTPYGSTTCWGLCIRPMAYPIGAFNAGLGDAPQANGAQAAAPTSPSSSATLKGFRLSITSVLKAGDIISFAGHGQRYSVRANASSDGSGNLTVTVAPGLKASIANSEAVTVQTSPSSMALPPVNTRVLLSVTCDLRLADGGQKDGSGAYAPGNILLIGGGDVLLGYVGGSVHPAQLLKDVALGYYGPCYRPAVSADGQVFTVALPPGKNVGDPQLTIAINTTGGTPGNLTDLIADTTFPAFRCPMDKPMPVKTFIEDYICKPYGLGYYFDGAGVMQIVDLRGPTTVAGLAALTDADLVDDTVPNWTYDPSQAYTVADVKVYGEAIIQPISSQLQTGGMFPVITSKMIEAQAGDLYDYTVGNPDLGLKVFTFDGKGYRAMPNEVLYGVGDPNLGLGAIGAVNNQRYPVIQAEAQAMVHNILRPYGHGVQTVVLTCARTSNVTNIFPGTFFTATITSTPDPGSNTRGVIRLYCCTQRVEKGPTVELTGVDWGSGVQANPPSLGTPTTIANDTAHACQCVLTPNAQNQPMEAWLAITPPTVVVRPVDASPLWFPQNRYDGATAVTALAYGLPAGSRVWWRARTYFGPVHTYRDPTTPITFFQLPSVWAYGVTSVDLSTVSAPTGLASSGITTTSFKITWANPDAALATEIWVSQPVGALRVFVARLTPGSKFYILTGLLNNTTYRVGVRAIDGKGGYAEATLDVTTANLGPIIVLPPPIGIRIAHLLF